MRLDEPVVENLLLTVENFEVGFGSFGGLTEIVDSVSLSIDKGGVVAVAGETGCGKSVTVKSISRLLNQLPAHVSGDIAFDGMKLLSLSDREFERAKDQRMSLVSQDPISSLNPAFTIKEQLTDTAQFGGDSDTGVVKFFRRRFSGECDEAREHVLEMLRGVQIPDPENIVDPHPSQSPGGMRQCALIAQVPLDKPDLLIAGETDTVLDVTIHDQILSLLKDLIKNYDPSVLMITHSLGIARQTSDCMYVMCGNRIVETVPTDKLFENPRRPYTQGLIVSIPHLTGDEMAIGIDDSAPEYLGPPSDCRFAPRCPYATVKYEEARPEMYKRGPQIGVGCVLYDEAVPTPERPIIKETRSHMTRRPGKQTGGD